MTSENKDLVAYCGLYCPKCYKMVVSEAADNLKKALNNTHICDSKNKSSNEFLDELDKLVKLKCINFCKAFGGSDTCKIRLCCRSKTIAGCWECNCFEKCNLLTNQFLVNIRKINQQGLDAFIKSVL
ncbi:DUF3795 domain-containing protein [Candidatus Woesearchaeota archaeon]|jgi:hypothetical protein|nr:DUF3795 domain-containing protein [Candidatus Woesearchaeota archaeon]MBT6518736.1 DUF3795 domain-containing protein [Candidatus Woesearchaeota archaeon]MBT7367907.1 DUF3795 domain-containing protein [Candidatus Woesearchaeota archaeon]